MISYVVEQHSRSYELVINTLCLGLLLQKFHNFKLIVDYDSFKPTEEDVHIHEIRKVMKRARINTLSSAAKATRSGCEYESTECYRSIIKKADLETKLERAILN